MESWRELQKINIRKKMVAKLTAIFDKRYLNFYSFESN